MRLHGLRRQDSRGKTATKAAEVQLPHPATSMGTPGSLRRIDMGRRSAQIPRLYQLLIRGTMMRTGGGGKMRTEGALTLTGDARKRRIDGGESRTIVNTTILCPRLASPWRSRRLAVVVMDTTETKAKALSRMGAITLRVQHRKLRTRNRTVRQPAVCRLGISKLRGRHHLLQVNLRTAFLRRRSRHSTVPRHMDSRNHLG